MPAYELSLLLRQMPRVNLFPLHNITLLLPTTKTVFEIVGRNHLCFKTFSRINS